MDVLDPGLYGPLLFANRENEIAHLAIHLIYSSSPLRRSFNKPGLPEDAFAGVPRGRMKLEQVVRLLRDVDAACDVVGIAIAEHLPWETLATRDLVRQLPLLSR